MSNLRDTLTRLRHRVDGSSVFMVGHQILTPRSLSHRRTIPEWTKHNESIQAVLLAAFPRLALSSHQRRRAGRWMRVIQLYYRQKKSYSETAVEMGLPPEYVHSMLRGIARTARGVRTDGSRRRDWASPRKRRRLAVAVWASNTAAVAAALDRYLVLPATRENYRRVLDLYFVQHLPASKVAKLVGCTQNNIRFIIKQLYRFSGQYLVCKPQTKPLMKK